MPKLHVKEHCCAIRWHGLYFCLVADFSSRVVSCSTGVSSHTIRIPNVFHLHVDVIGLATKNEANSFLFPNTQIIHGGRELTKQDDVFNYLCLQNIAFNYVYCQLDAETKPNKAK